MIDVAFRTWAWTFFLSTWALSSAWGAEVDLRQATVICPAKLSRQESKAIDLLVEEVHKRTLIDWKVGHTWPADSVPVIAVGPAASLDAFAGAFATQLAADRDAAKPEGYRIRVEGKSRSAPTVFVIGSDARGVLFGVGRLLRALHLSRDRITLADDFRVSTAPRFPLRGHQLGYRPKTNSYDGWTLAIWEQYIRDLAVFGTNTVELIPPRSDDDADSPLFPLPPMEMMVGMSKLLDDYGLDVWIWYPAMDRDYTDAGTVAAALKEWGDVFRRLPRIDAVFVPGGDPGHTQPRHLFALLEKQADNLHRFHPKAQLWVSPQGFTAEWLEEFLALLKQEPPRWLTGVVFGPQVRIGLAELRAAVPGQYPIRQYPDITHSRQCQYPVPDWDLVFALTEGREGINPRPRGEAQVFRAFMTESVGFVTYSEGCNDDVNKIIWSSLGWDAKADVLDILREYSRYFIGEHQGNDFAQGLLALENNWRGPLLANESVATTLQQFRRLEKSASPADLLNWRFQQALYRAYYDAYLRSRLIYETDLEERALEKLRAAAGTGTLLAMNEAEAILDRARTQPVAGDWRARVSELAEALFQSIRMQLSTERYRAIAAERGANLDTIDMPLNNRSWLKEQFARVRQLSGEADRLREIDAIVNWTDPGPGGFYDDLGCLGRPSHLVLGLSYAEDPGSLRSPRRGFTYFPGWRLAWCRHAESLYDAPLKMRYTGLDPNATYKIRIIYAGDSPSRRIRLVAGDAIEIHPLIRKERPVRPVEFAIPKAATKTGHLDLTWFGESGRGGNGRGCQVGEVWLMKK
jgi:hypothetical protein